MYPLRQLDMPSQLRKPPILVQLIELGEEPAVPRRGALGSHELAEVYFVLPHAIERRKVFPNKARKRE